jgi:hypothetical protein
MRHQTNASIIDIEKMDDRTHPAAFTTPLNDSYNPA